MTGHGAGGRLLGLLALVGLLAVVLLVSLGLGSRDVGVLESWRLLWADVGGVEGTIVRGLRLPRGLLAVVVGAALGLAGALMQGLTRNPLADPGLLGVNAGAAAAVVVGVGVLGAATPSAQTGAALAGAAAAMLAVHVLGRGGGSPDRLVLAGAAVSAVLAAGIQGALVLSPSAFDVLRSWNLGSLSGRGPDVLVPVALVVGPAVGIGLLLARGLDALALGERAGAALGVRATRIELVGGVLVTVLCGGATAAVGPIGFLGLAVPHAVRTLVGPGHRWVLPYSVVLAPIVLLAADVIGRVVAPPSEVPRPARDRGRDRPRGQRGGAAERVPQRARQPRRPRLHLRVGDGRAPRDPAVLLLRDRGVGRGPRRRAHDRGRRRGAGRRPGRRRERRPAPGPGRRGRERDGRGGARRRGHAQPQRPADRGGRPGLGRDRRRRPDRLRRARRASTGPTCRAATPVPAASAAVGAAIVVLGDLLAQRALPTPLPVGVATGVLGGLYLIGLLTVRWRSGR